MLRIPMLKLQLKLSLNLMLIPIDQALELNHNRLLDCTKVCMDQPIQWVILRM